MLRSYVDMMEALRLTRQGRLQEAMSVLRGERAEDAPPPPRAGEGAATVLDMIAPSHETGNAWTAPGAGRTSGVRTAPDAMPAAATFESHAFSNESEAGATSCTFPADSGASLCRWW